LGYAEYKNLVWEQRPEGLLQFLRRFIDVSYARLRFHVGPKYYSLFEFEKRCHADWKAYLLDYKINPEIRKLNAAGVDLATDKLQFFEHCNKSGLPTVPILAIFGYKNQISLDDLGLISNPQELEAFLNKAPSKLFFKPSGGAHGDGAFVSARQGDRWLFGSYRTIGDLWRDIGETPYIIQPCVTPHQKLCELTGTDVLCTIRVVTWMDEGVVKILLPVFRIPAGKNITDNFSEGENGNIAAPIDPVTGVVGCGKMSIGTKLPVMVNMQRHPDTGSQIEGRVIPYWGEALELLMCGQKAMPMLKTVGWDLAITDSGPIIVEANAGYGVGVLQTAHDRGIRGDLQPIFDSVN